jgi:hypothetical protein
VLLTRFLRIKPDFMLFETSIAPGRPVLFSTIS